MLKHLTNLLQQNDSGHKCQSIQTCPHLNDLNWNVPINLEIKCIGIIDVKALQMKLFRSFSFKLLPKP